MRLQSQLVGPADSRQLLDLEFCDEYDTELREYWWVVRYDTHGHP